MQPEIITEKNMMEWCKGSLQQINYSPENTPFYKKVIQSQYVKKKKGAIVLLLDARYAIIVWVIVKHLNYKLLRTFKWRGQATLKSAEVSQQEDFLINDTAFNPLLPIAHKSARIGKISILKQEKGSPKKFPMSVATMSR